MNVVYLATREPSYSRVRIVQRALATRCSVETIYSSARSYPVRLLVVATRILLARLTGRLNHADVLFAGFLAQPLLPWVRLLWRGPLVADAYLSLYDTLVHDKQRLREGSLLARAAFWLDQYLLRRADLCLTDTEAHVEYFQRTFGTAGCNIRRLWVSSEYSYVTATSSGAIAPFRVFFWGGFIPLQGVDTIIRAAVLLNAHNVHFTVVGRGQTYARCVELHRDLQGSNVDFQAWMKPDEIANVAARAQVILGIFGTTAKAGRVIPNKVFEALAMGRPVITRQSSAIGELLQDQRDVLLVPAGDPQRLADKILWVKDHPAEAAEIGRRGYETFQRNASPAQVEAILYGALREMTRSRPRATPREFTRRASNWQAT